MSIQLKAEIASGGLQHAGRQDYGTEVDLDQILNSAP
jgi:hypothetical protein